MARRDRGSSAALGILLQDGIGDTIRISLTPEPGGDRTVEVQVAQELLQTMGFRTFVPLVCCMPGLRPHHFATFQNWRARSRTSSARKCPLEDAYPASKSSTSLSWAASSTPRRIQACQYRISLPHRRNAGRSVFVDGKKFRTLRGASIRRLQGAGESIYDQKYGAGAKAPVTAAE